MKPSKSTFAHQDDWVKAMATWMDEDPTTTNKKKFIIFESSTPDNKSISFMGDLNDFADQYFYAMSWVKVAEFIKENNYCVSIEDDMKWDDYLREFDETEDLPEFEFKEHPKKAVCPRRMTGPEWSDI